MFGDSDQGDDAGGPHAGDRRPRLLRPGRSTWLYLGLAIRENRSMAYELALMPHERRVDGAWQGFSRE